MINGETRCRVWNYAKYDIGLKLLNGFEYNVKPGSFIVMSANDILYIESTYPRSALFTKKLLVATDEAGNPVELQDIGLPPAAEEAHMADDEIAALLKSSAKKIEATIAEITDQAELHGIYEVAKQMDLPLQKVKILKKYMPDKDWLDELGE